MSEFKKIALEDGVLLRKYLVNDNNLSCEFSFGNNVLWNPGGKLEYQIVEEVLVYRMIFEEEIVYCTPDFKGKVSRIVHFIEADAASIGKKYSISCLNVKMMGELKDAFPEQYVFTTNRNQSDYIYLVDKLAELKGGKYHKKKNHVNKFRKNYEFSYEEIGEDNIEECRAMKNLWMLKRETMDESLQVETKAIDMALDHYKEFGFTGGLIRVEGKVKAFTMGERLSSDTFVTHFEKAMDDMDGLYAIINQQFAQNTLQGNYVYVNREDDMGLEGLRQAKLSYYPEYVYDKYAARALERK